MSITQTLSIKQRAESEILGIDLKFPLEVDGNGRLVTVSGKANLEQALITLIETNKGTMLYARNLGVDADKQIHEDIDRTAMTFPRYLERELMLQEKRLKSVSIEAEINYEERVIELIVTYEAITYGIQGNFTYSLQIGRSNT